MLDSFDVPAPVPFRRFDADPDAMGALTEADVAWLDLMGDVLPESMPVSGSTRWRDAAPWAPWITMEKVRG